MSSPISPAHRRTLRERDRLLAELRRLRRELMEERARTASAQAVARAETRELRRLLDQERRDAAPLAYEVARLRREVARNARLLTSG